MAFFASGALADDDVPKCTGSDRAAAQKAHAAGLAKYRASARTGAGDPEMAAALTFFDQSCAAGETAALELRAYTLAALERYVEASKSLEAFLAVHPLDSLPDDVRARVESQAPEIAKHVATLSVSTKPDGAKITLDGKELGSAPLKDVRVALGKHQIKAEIGDRSEQREVDLAPGKSEESFDLSPKEIEPPPKITPKEEPKKASLVPLIVTSGALTGVSLVIGLAGAIWSNDQAEKYNNRVCSRTAVAPPECAGFKSDFAAGRALEVTGLIAAGVFGVATGVMLALEVGGKSKPATAACAPSFTGGSCRFQF